MSLCSFCSYNLSYLELRCHVSAKKKKKNHGWASRISKVKLLRSLQTYRASLSLSIHFGKIPLESGIYKLVWAIKPQVSNVQCKWWISSLIFSPLLPWTLNQFFFLSLFYFYRLLFKSVLVIFLPPPQNS